MPLGPFGVLVVLVVYAISNIFGSNTTTAIVPDHAMPADWPNYTPGLVDGLDQGVRFDMDINAKEVRLLRQVSGEPALLWTRGEPRPFLWDQSVLAIATRDGNVIIKGAHLDVTLPMRQNGGV